MFEENKIYNDDCISFLQNNVPDETFDLIFADPPFNLSKNYGKYDDRRIDYYEWCEKWISECFRTLKKTGSMYLMTTQTHLKNMLINMDDHGIMRNIIVWKNTSMPLKNKYSIAYQPILFYTKSSQYYYKKDADGEPYKGTLPWGRKPKGFTMKDLWDDIPFLSGGCMASKESILYPGTKKKHHPCQMPLKLANRILLASSKDDDFIFEPFCGSGTFVVKAKELNRRFIGTERNKEYIEKIILPRLEQL